MSAPAPGLVHQAFSAARAQGRSLLVGYLPAGFPDRQGSVDAVRAMVAGGVDVIEIGLPYSDPVMDGPVIQQAVDRALAAGTRITDVIATAGEVAALGVPTLVMTYWNPIERFGVDRFAQALSSAGGAGTITPDLTPEESGPWIQASRACGLDTVFLVAPSSPDSRIDAVASVTSGFVYAASTMGVTGTRGQVGDRAAELVSRVKARTSLPVAVGLGVSTGEQAAEVATYADGVIVGSAFVRPLLDDPGPGGLRAVENLARSMAEGIRQARRDVPAS